MNLNELSLRSRFVLFVLVLVSFSFGLCFTGAFPTSLIDLTVISWWVFFGLPGLVLSLLVLFPISSKVLSGIYAIATIFFFFVTFFIKDSGTVLIPHLSASTFVLIGILILSFRVSTINSELSSI